MCFNIEMDEYTYMIIVIALGVLLGISEILGSVETFDANSIATLTSSIISRSIASSPTTTPTNSSSSSSSSSDDIPLGIIQVTSLP